jgi:hypothetical protein
LYDDDDDDDGLLGFLLFLIASKIEALREGESMDDGMILKLCTLGNS